MILNCTHYDLASLSLASLSRSVSLASTNSVTETSIGSTNAEHGPDANDANAIGITDFGLPEPKQLGQLISSFFTTDLARDWALVEFSKASVERSQVAISKVGLLQYVALPTRFESIPENGAEVVVVKGYSGISRGSISSSTTLMKLQPRGTFQEVWTVRLDGDGKLGKFSNFLD